MADSKLSSSPFAGTLSGAAPPSHWLPPLAALWWDARGDWAQAHALVAPEETDPAAAWVHAYLHRSEGDAFNARYWYGRAGQPVSRLPLEDERAAIATALLAVLGRR